MNENPNPEKPKSGLLIYLKKESKTRVETPSGGRVSNALSRSIAYDRDPSLFDTLPIKQRDALIKSDIENSIRRNSPVDLSPEEFSMTFALSFGISQDIAKEEVQKAISMIRARKQGERLYRYVDIGDMAKFLYGRKDSTQKAYVIRDLLNLSKKVQVFMIGDNIKKLRPMVSPLVFINPENIIFKEVDGTRISVTDFEEFIKTSSPKQIAESIEGINVGFGLAFLYNLDTQWGYLPYKTFEILRGNKTELFQKLLTTLLSNYVRFRNAADGAEAELKKELNKTKRISIEEYKDRIRQARKEALSFELNVDSIKAKIGRDYKSTKQYRALFWKDLEKVARDLIAIDLITGYDRTKGARGQDKVIFHYSETYNYSDSSSTDERPKLLTDAKGNSTDVGEDAFYNS